MSLELANPPAAYDMNDQAQMRRALKAADRENMKRGDAQDYIKMRDTVTGTIVTVTVASGVLVVA